MPICAKPRQTGRKSARIWRAPGSSFPSYTRNSRASLERLQQDKEGVQRRLEEQDAMLAELRHELGHETTRADTAEARTEEITQRVEDLKGELQRARDEATGLRNEACRRHVRVTRPNSSR